MRIAFFSPKPFSKSLGATKNRIELAEALEALGWNAFIINNESLGLKLNVSKNEYRVGLKKYLIEHAKEFDVVLYEYDTLPFERNLFSKETLLISRPAILDFNIDNIAIPVDFKTKLSRAYHWVVNLLSGRLEKKMKLEENSLRKLSLHESDVIQVQNKSDFYLLTSLGYPSSKIILIPNGISEQRWKSFKMNQPDFEAPIKIAFVGTFDFRKGAMDFPYIFNIISSSFPDIRLKLLGTKGLYKTSKEVLNFFPSNLWSRIEVVPSFDSDLLPQLLNDCQIGIFPSYLESFGFGALEMMAAGLPVIGYKAPGPSDFLLEELLIEIGDKKRLAQKVVEVLKRGDLKELSEKARRVAEQYSWTEIAKTANLEYSKRVQGIRTFNKDYPTP